INQGRVAHCRGSVEAAAVSFVDALTRFAALGDREGVAAALEGLAQTSIDASRALRLLAAATVIREAIGAPVPRLDRPALDESCGRVSDSLTPEAANAAWSAGRALTFKEAVSE